MLRIAGGPLPKFDGIAPPPGLPSSAAPLQAQASGGPIRVPPLTQDKVTQFSNLFEESGAQNGQLSGKISKANTSDVQLLIAHPGENARSIFERAQLPNDVLGRIWNLADTEQRGQLGLTEFIIAMHLLSSFKNGSMRALPQILPVGLYEAAARRGVPRQTTGSRPTSDGAPASAIPRQFSGAGFPNRPATFQQPMDTGDQWVINPQDKAQFDQIYATVDTQNRGFITGEQAVGFFSNSRLPEDALAQIWDLADINSEGQLNRDEFAVAMYLIRQQRSKKDGRDVLPESLPPNLIPPSLRRQPIAPQQPTAPAFDNAANITKPKSASEDLFGLDAILPSSPTQAKAPSDSLTSSPARSQTLPPQPPAQQQPLHFKPFVPSSSFGQTIMTPQGTGTSSSASPVVQNRGLPSTSQPASAMDDLLGDNDPEVSKRLTNETSELANLSNQVSTLTNQMTEVKTNRGAADQNFGQAQSQKRDFEARLAQLRAAYQQEVKEVQALQERLRVSKEETKKLQSDMALIEGSHHDLQNQHQQVAQALSADQTENARLKEKISQTNAEINDLKPRLEKMRLDARQQKGLVAIYKKQLAGSENERDKHKADMDGATDEHQQATREIEEHKVAIEAAPKAVSSPPPAASAPAVASPPVASPAPSTASMNPFFRRPSNPAGTDRGMTSPFTPAAPQSITSPNHNAFDSFFGPSAPSATGPPQTSFGTAQATPPTSHGMPLAAAGGAAGGLAAGGLAAATMHSHSKESSEGPDIPTPSASPPPSNFSDSPQNANEPPAPPQSRQITSSILPLRPNVEREGSDTSSVRVMPPGSRMGDRSVSGFDTPVNAPSEAAIPESPKQHFEEVQGRDFDDFVSVQTPQQNSEGIQPQHAHVPDTLSESSGMPSVTRDVPGAFPGDETPDRDAFKPGASPYTSSTIDPRVDPTPRATEAPATQAPVADPFAKLHTPTSASANDDFDSAFAGFGNSKGKAPEHTNGTATSNGFEEPGPAMAHGEFPPIREFGGDDESDSDEGRGFDDDFTQHSANRTKESGRIEGLQGQAPAAGGLAPPRPALSTTDSNLSQLPTPGAMASPPTYDATVGSGTVGRGDRKDSNQFPAEYSGLLPQREMSEPESSSPPASHIANSAGIDRGLNFFGNDTAEGAAGRATVGSPFASTHAPMSPGASTSAPYAYNHNSPMTSPPTVQPTNPPVPAKAPKDEFDEFDDLSEAKEAPTDDADDDLRFSRSTRGNDAGFDDFNPVFDSPMASRTTAQGSTSSATFPQQTDGFADFEASPAASSGAGASRGVGAPTEPPSHDWDAIFAGLDGPQGSNGTQAAEERGLGFSPPKDPPPGQGSGINSSPSKAPAIAPVPDDAADDPILSRLTGMGYPRGKSLDALEKFDYNIDKVCS